MIAGIFNATFTCNVYFTWAKNISLFYCVLFPRSIQGGKEWPTMWQWMNRYSKGLLRGSYWDIGEPPEDHCSIAGNSFCLQCPYLCLRGQKWWFKAEMLAHAGQICPHVTHWTFVVLKTCPAKLPNQRTVATVT